MVVKGMLVEIADDGKMFTTYEDFVCENLPNKRRFFKPGMQPKENEMLVVRYVGPHLTRPKNNPSVAIVESVKGDAVFVVDTRGLKQASLIVDLKDTLGLTPLKRAAGSLNVW